jgi:tape measure domain-containing protein
MDIATLGIKIDTKDVDAAKRDLRELANESGRTASATERMQKDFNKVAGAARTFQTAIKGIAVAMVALAAAWIGRQVIELGASFISAASSMERLNIGLKSVTGSAQAAGQALTWIKDFARTTPFQMEGVSRAFIMLKNAGIDPMNKALKAVGEATAALGGTDEMLMGVATALSQIAAKGKVSMEELNQLAERGIAARQILAEQFGIAVSQLESHIKKAGITSEQALDALFTGMNEKYGGAMDEMANTWAGVVGALRQTWEELGIAFVEAGIFDEVKRIAKGLTGLIDDLRGEKAFQNLAESIGNLVTMITNLGNQKETLESISATFQTMASAINAATRASNWFIETQRQQREQLGVDVWSKQYLPGMDLMGMPSRRFGRPQETPWGGVQETPYSPILDRPSGMIIDIEMDREKESLNAPKKNLKNLTSVWKRP